MGYRRWAPEEDQRLLAYVRSAGGSENVCWEDLDNAVVSRRTGQACKKRYYRLRAMEREAQPEEPPHPPPEFLDLLTPEMDVDEWLEALPAMQSLRLKAEPHQVVATVEIETDGMPVAFIPTSCWHVGGLYTFYEGFKEKLQELLDVDRLYWGVHGDEWEGFPPGWGSTVFLNLMPPHLQRRLVAKLIEKIHGAGKLLYSCWSNHPAFLERQTGEDQSAALYMGKVPYFRAAGVVILKLGEQRYILDVAHSFPGHSYHNPSHSQGRELAQGLPQADFVIQGHKHSYAYQEYSHRTKAYDAGLQENLIAHLVQVGTAKTGPDPYTLRRWNRGVLIWPAFLLSARKHEIARVCDRVAMEWYLSRTDF